MNRLAEKYLGLPYIGSVVTSLFTIAVVVFGLTIAIFPLDLGGQLAYYFPSNNGSISDLLSFLRTSLVMSFVVEVLGTLMFYWAFYSVLNEELHYNLPKWKLRLTWMSYVSMRTVIILILLAIQNPISLWVAGTFVVLLFILTLFVWICFYAMPLHCFKCWRDIITSCKEERRQLLDLGNARSTIDMK